MSNMQPVAIFGLKVPAEDGLLPAALDFPATIRITMAAIDPDASTEGSGRATLKMVFNPAGPEDPESDSDDDDDEEAYMQRLLDGEESDGLSGAESSSDEESKVPNGTDKTKLSKKERKAAAAKELIEAIRNAPIDDQEEDDEEEDDMDIDDLLKSNGKSKSKSKKAKSAEADQDAEEEDDEDEDDYWPDGELEDSELEGLKEVVICTLDTKSAFQQPIDITIPEDQPTYFKVTGSHAIYLTGNYVVLPDEQEDSEDDEDDYDLSPDEDELDYELGEEDDDSDLLDDLVDPRITEVGSDEEQGDQAPALVEAPTKAAKSAKKGKNKRAAEDDEEAGLDAIMAKSIKSDDAAAVTGEKLSKKQAKKLKNNAGKAVEGATQGKNDRKVQFAEKLEQGPTPSATPPSTKKSEPKTTAGEVKTVQGVKIDDRKVGTGPSAKKGDKLGLRYIGKLSNGKVFDANKKGSPFRFKLGAGQVIKGWEIGLAGMAVGGERRITIPSSLAYGKTSQAGIPANSELQFDVKLLEIN